MGGLNLPRRLTGLRDYRFLNLRKSYCNFYNAWFKSVQIPGSLIFGVDLKIPSNFR